MSCFRHKYNLCSVILYNEAYPSNFHSKAARPHQSLSSTLPSTVWQCFWGLWSTSLVDKCLSGRVICVWFCYPVLAVLACGWITPQPHWVITDQLAHNRVSTTTIPPSLKWSQPISPLPAEVNRWTLQKEDLPSFHDGLTKWKDEYLRTFFRRFVGWGEEF